MGLEPAPHQVLDRVNTRKTVKQILQNLKSGQIQVADVPCPKVRPGHLLIQSRASLISAGTERMLVEFGRASLLAKARAQPEKVRQALDKIRTDGLLPTMEAVFSRLDEPLPLGYCNAGVVVEVGEGVEGWSVGERVANNGPHAEMVCVPRNLCAKIPDGVGDEQAAFAFLASIGLQGIRLLAPTLGETVVVTGLGLIGLMAVQLLRANGCHVLGIDIDPKRLELARGFGAETVDLPAGADPVASALAYSDGRGVDGVLITASSKSNMIVRQAAGMCRKRGRIVLVGVVGLELNRSDFYKKELSFQVSCSYGPGRYDPAYEAGARDYPVGFVRWTEQRNLSAVLDLLAQGRLDVQPLIGRRVEQAEAQEAYRLLTERSEALGILLTYPSAAPPLQRVATIKPSVAKAAARMADTDGVVLGLIGAGTFVKRTLLPALKGCRIERRTIASAGGVSSMHAGEKFGFQQATSDPQTILADAEINLVIIATRHDLHAEMICAALEAGKHVMVEKPLCLNATELRRIGEAVEKCPGQQLLVGFNRRFSPHALKMKSLLATRVQPICMSMLVNAGAVSPDSWVQDKAVGGGRIIGEGCHWIDLMSFLAGSPVVQVAATRMGPSPGVDVRDDKMSITLQMADGSIGTLHYFANGHTSYPKETLEVFCDDKVLSLENFRVLRGYGWSGFSKMKLRRQDKGHAEELSQLIDVVRRGGASLMPFEQIENVTRATFAAMEAAESGHPVRIE